MPQDEILAKPQSCANPFQQQWYSHSVFKRLSWYNIKTVKFVVSKLDKASLFFHPHFLSNTIQYVLLLANSNWGGRKEGSGKEQEWPSYNRSFMSPRNGRCMSHICGFFRYSLSLGRISQLKFPWCRKSNWCLTTSFLVSQLLGGPHPSWGHLFHPNDPPGYSVSQELTEPLPSPGRLVRTMSLHGPTTSGCGVGSQRSHPL